MDILPLNVEEFLASQHVTNQKKFLDALLDLINTSICPDSNCDNEGTTFIGDPRSPYFRSMKCTWCDQRRAILKELKQ